MNLPPLRYWWARFLLGAAGLALLGPVALGQNLAQNPGFESGTTGWFGFGSVSLTSSTAQPRTGSRSALVQNRTQTWNGVAQSLVGVLQPGINYRISAWVRLVSGAPQPVLLTIQKVDGSGTSYANVASGTANSTGWTQLSGGYTHSVNGTLTNLNLYVEGPPAGVDFYADDFVIEPYDWKVQANARIEQIRKRDVRLLIIDPDGNPVPGVNVSVRQTRSGFAFGSAINGNISNPNYAAFFRTNFEWAVMENESKWYSNEPSRSNVTYTAANRITNYCATNGITMRGHTIFWAVPGNVQTWVTNLSNADLLVHLTNRLNSVVNHFKGTFVHWDVNNELLHGDFFGQRLGGWVNPWMFQHARSLDPNVKLFVNDYNVIASNQTEAYKQQILGLISSNAPIDGIGAQGHFGAVINPTTTEARLDSLAQLGLPIWITEYDSVNADENVRADNLEVLYRMAFSKQAVDGVLMWGFWAGSHWRGSNAAIVNLNWTLNEAGLRYQSLLAEWKTMTNGTSGTGGEFNFRGFHGNYDITLTPPGGQPTLRRITLEPGAGANIVTLVAHSTGAQPVLHHPERATGSTQIRYQLTGNAGRAYAIESSTNLSSTNWTTLATVSNLTGTLWYTSPSAPPQLNQFFRARLLP
ncbi:MAG TPA: endo-1,4-beta-xylanase [Verrucomicrobiae bacterium]|nr:endo-1,4-beta-xylanase [Verrucomicrobiae bacterium]